MKKLSALRREKKKRKRILIYLQPKNAKKNFGGGGGGMERKRGRMLKTVPKNNGKFLGFKGILRLNRKICLRSENI